MGDKLEEEKLSLLDHALLEKSVQNRFYQQALEFLAALRKCDLENINIFEKPVDPVRDCAPKYYDIIMKPMSLSVAEHKLKDADYKSLGDFFRDILLIWDNAVRYNANPLFTVHKNALSFRNMTEEHMDNLIKRNQLDKHARTSKKRKKLPSGKQDQSSLPNPVKNPIARKRKEREYQSESSDSSLGSLTTPKDKMPKTQMQPNIQAQQKSKGSALTSASFSRQGSQKIASSSRLWVALNQKVWEQCVVESAGRLNQTFKDMRKGLGLDQNFLQKCMLALDSEFQAFSSLTLPWEDQPFLESRDVSTTLISGSVKGFAENFAPDHTFWAQSFICLVGDLKGELMGQQWTEEQRPHQQYALDKIQRFLDDRPSIDAKLSVNHAIWIIKQVFDILQLLLFSNLCELKKDNPPDLQQAFSDLVRLTLMCHSNRSTTNTKDAESCCLMTAIELLIVLFLDDRYYRKIDNAYKLQAIYTMKNSVRVQQKQKEDGSFIPSSCTVLPQFRGPSFRDIGMSFIHLHS